MIKYLIMFTFYTLAMVGVMVVGFFVYKKTTFFQKKETKNLIKILDRISIAPKKSLMIAKVQDEKFLIALDSDRTTFLAKLENKEEIQNIIQNKEETIQPQKEEPKHTVQKQFMELYSQNEDEDLLNKITRKDVVRKLIKNLNKETKTGSY